MGLDLDLVGPFQVIDTWHLEFESARHSGVLFYSVTRLLSMFLVVFKNFAIVYTFFKNVLNYDGWLKI